MIFYDMISHYSAIQIFKRKPNFEVKIWFLRYQKFNFCTICIHKLHKLHVTSRLVQQEAPTKQMTVFQVTPHRCRIHRPSDQVEKCWEHYGCDGPAQVGDEVTKEVGWHGFHQRNIFGKENCILHGFLWCFLSISSSRISACAIAFPILCTRSWRRVFRGTSPQVRRFSKKITHSLEALSFITSILQPRRRTWLS